MQKVAVKLLFGKGRPAKRPKHRLCRPFWQLTNWSTGSTTNVINREHGDRIPFTLTFHPHISPSRFTLTCHPHNSPSQPTISISWGKTNLFSQLILHLFHPKWRRSSSPQTFFDLRTVKEPSSETPLRLAELLLTLNWFPFANNYYLRNRKHVPCFYRVIQTQVEVWENERCFGNTSPWARFSKAPESHCKISNLTITELLYSRILNRNRGSLRTRSFRRIDLSVFRYT